MPLDLGPVCPEEAALITALTRMVAAVTVVEFGYGWGVSARAFLAALPPDGLLVSFDPASGSPLEARHRLVRGLAQDFTPDDVDGAPVDVVFFDADHQLDTSQAAWHRVWPSLAADALVLVHDTGYWPADLWPDAPPYGVVDDQGRRWHRWDEGRFVRWLERFGFSRVDLCASRELRHGLSVLRRAD